MVDPTHGLSPAPAWGQWTGFLGKGAVLASLVLFSGAAVLWVARRPSAARLSFYGGVAGLLAAFGTLAALFLGNQFQYEYVFNHSETGAAVKYKIAAIWTAQEGSFLLWSVASAIFAVLALRGTRIYERWYGVITSVFLAALSGILAYETPFGLMKEIVKDGQAFLPPMGNGIPPTLNNYWVVVHPPVIFMGFGSLVVPFALAGAAMMERNAVDWTRIARPWALISLAVLGMGVCMGGLWAYETQGWGGFWGWDPVENASFVPWLFMAALSHGLIVQITKGRMAGSNLMLAGLAFVAFVYGTFLTRSGLLDNVSNHSFASMHTSALVILRTLLVAYSAGFVGLYVWRGRSLAKEKAPDAETGFRREAFYRFGALMLSLLGFVIALGMSWPVLTALRGGQGSKVEEFLYHRVVAWFFIPTMLAMAVAPFVSWRGMGTRALFMRVVNVFSVSLFLTGMALVALQKPDWGLAGNWEGTVAAPWGVGRLPAVPVIAFLLLLCAFVAVSALWRAVESARNAKSSLGAFVAHLGFAVLLGGLIVSRGLERKEQVFVQAGTPSQTSMGYTLTFKDFTKDEITDKDNLAVFDVTARDGTKFEARPGMYSYQSNNELKWQVWPYVQRYAFHDVYFSLHPPVLDVWEKPQSFQPGEKRKVDGVTVQYVKPLQEGTPGQAGAKFGALMLVTVKKGDEGVEETYETRPMIGLTENGVVPDMAPAGPDLFAIMGRMDAATKSVDMRLMFRRPLYPVELYTKPLTWLVWIGMGILSLGGLMSAYARRVRKDRPNLPDSNAPVSAA